MKVITLAAVVALLAIGAARAAEGDGGQIYAASYAAIPAGADLRVEAPARSADVDRLKQLIEWELGDRGYGITEDAPFVLTFSTGADYAASDGSDTRLLEVDGAGGNSGTTGAQAVVSVFSSQEGNSLLDYEPSTPDVYSSRYNLIMSVRDAESGRSVWKGQAHADVRGSDPLSVTESLVPVVVDTLGQSVNGRSFTLQ